MDLVLTRETYTDTSTIGELHIGGKYECHTLEDRVREQPGVPVAKWKIPNKTAIPAGEYKVIITYSNRFKKDLPLLVNVPGFSGVRIHSGNGPEDTEGCILVGRLDRGRTDWISNSRITMSKLMQKLEEAYDRDEPITLRIIG